MKLALLAEGDISPDVLDYLASDSDPLVALEVAQMQDHQHDAATAPAGRAHHHH
ncbi:hypothetical protein Bequi_09795 [Brachybacterium sp. JHP9]|uniref:Uncharacterized protein n=1 Tax=Brachybacterium equifaecis TaxID=2910770 RepID=A0ABT0R175_9MICO|nr:hypothetical protein [Brachybacterium equifaecis]MCL6423675.1 hypothetical protein [Brachybacterium equifaecis]